MGFTHHETHASLKRDIESMSNITADQQPLLPWLYKNTHPALLMTRSFENNVVLEIRIWHSFISNQDKNGTKIWIGAINFHTRQKFFSWKTHYQSIKYSQNKVTASDWLQRHLNHQMWQSQHIEANNLIENKGLRAMQWKGNILLIRNCNSLTS